MTLAVPGNFDLLIFGYFASSNLPVAVTRFTGCFQLATMAEQQEEHESVGRDQLIAGEDDRSGIQAKDDAALLVNRCQYPFHW